MIDRLLSMPDEELVAQGYLVIRRFGNVTQYIPTDKYRATMMLPPRTAVTITDMVGSFVFEPGDVYYICGECGYDLHPRCACPLTGHVVPSPFRLLTDGTEEDDMRPKAPTEVLINPRRPLITPLPGQSGRYSLISADVTDGEVLPYNPALHEETVVIKVRRK